MKPHLIEVGDQPDAKAEQLLGSGLAAFNEHVTGSNDRRPLTVLIKHPDTGETLGGSSQAIEPPSAPDPSTVA